MNNNNIIVVDSIMGSGKTSWCIDELLNQHLDENILYITPFLDEVKRIKSAATSRNLMEPVNKGSGKIGNIADLLQNQKDIVSTHELFKRFDEKCKQALKDNYYTLIIDETITAVEPYSVKAKDDFKYLLKNKDIDIDDNGLIRWTGSELDTRYTDIKILAENKSLFRVDDKFYLWHYPPEVFHLFKQVYILTYLFDGSIMKYYFDLYNFNYETKSVKYNCESNKYELTDYYEPSRKYIRKRINIYKGQLNQNISVKSNALSASWFKYRYNQSDINQLQKNLNNLTKNIYKCNSDSIMWTTYKNDKKLLKGKGYTNGFVPCNARATNDFCDKTYLYYCCNWYVNPEIKKFFQQKNITINQDKIALAMLLQWIWRSNIRVPNSNKAISIYIPSSRMRELFEDWLNQNPNAA